MDRPGVGREVDEAVGFFDFGGVGGKGVVLRLGHKGTVAQGIHRAEQDARTRGGQFIVDGLEVIVVLDGNLLAQEHISRVQTLGHIHGGDTRHGVTVHDGALHGCGTAQGGQERAVDVDAAVAGEIQHREGQDLAVGHHDDEIGVQLGEGLVKRTVPQGGGLVDGDVLLGGVHLDGGWGEDVAPSAGLIGLGHNAHDLLARLAEGAQRVQSEIGCSHEYNTHNVSFPVGRIPSKALKRGYAGISQVEDL